MLPGKKAAHPELPAAWRYLPENKKFRPQIQQTIASHRQISNEFIPARPLPKVDDWFETVWAAHRRGAIYQ